MRCLQQAAVAGDDGGFGAGAGVELGQDVGDVGADGAAADVEGAGALGVRLAGGEEAQHVDFAR